MVIRLSGEGNISSSVVPIADDNLYRAAFIGISANVVTLVVALLVILLDIKEKIQRIFVSVEIASIITSLVFFIWSIRLMLFVISRLKDKE